VSDHDYGPLRVYEITWKSGHIETVHGHQVMFGSTRMDFSSLMGGVTTRAELPPRFTVHGMFDGYWRLVLTGPEADLVSIRDVTDREQVPEAGSGTEAGS
jgi:hypothetical protein